MTDATLVVRNIGALVTGDAARGEPPGAVPDAVLAARDQTVIFAGPASESLGVAVAKDALEIDAGGAAVIPGFVDAHSHITWVGDRAEEYARRAAGTTYDEIAQRGGGIRATMRATSQATVGQVAEAAAERARSMLRRGTTTVEVKSGYGLDHAAEMRLLDAVTLLRQRPDVPDAVTTYLPLHAPPEGDPAELVDSVCRTGVREAAARGAAFCDAYCDVGAFGVGDCERVLVAAARAGLRTKLHADQRSPSGGARLAARIGATSADHLEHADHGDLRGLAAAHVVGVLLPGAALVLGGPPPPGRRLLEAGGRVAVATDCNPGTCYSESMPLMVSLAVATAGLTPAQAIVAATAGGAAALALTDRGMLRAGMRCDAVILKTPHWIDVAYHLGADVVGSVIRGGRLMDT